MVRFEPLAAAPRRVLCPACLGLACLVALVAAPTMTQALEDTVVAPDRGNLIYRMLQRTISGKPDPNAAADQTRPDLGPLDHQAAILGKWDVRRDGCRSGFLEFLADGMLRNVVRDAAGTGWDLHADWPVGRYTRDGARIQVSLRDSQWVNALELRQQVGLDQTGRLVRMDENRRARVLMTGFAQRLENRTVVSAPCPAHRVAGADRMLRGATESALTKRDRFETEFAREVGTRCAAHPPESADFATCYAKVVVAMSKGDAETLEAVEALDPTTLSTTECVSMLEQCRRLPSRPRIDACLTRFDSCVPTPTAER